MADLNVGKAVELNVGIQQALEAIKLVRGQAAELRTFLSQKMNIGDDKYTQQMAEVRKALKDQGTALQAFQSSLTTFDAKVGQLTQSINAKFEKLGTSIGIQANQIQRAQAAVKAALTSGNLGGGASQYTTAATAAEALAAQMQRVVAVIAKADIAKRGYASSAALEFELKRESMAAAGLQARLTELTASEKQAALQARQLATEQANLARQQNRPLQLFQSQTARFVNYAALGAAIGGSYEVGKQVIELDTALHNLQGITQTTDAGMVKLRTTILSVSEASKFSASDVAKAATTLGQAGLSAAQIGEALKSVVLFAQASGSSLEESVNIMTSAMGAFNLQASELSNVADVFTAALNSSKLNIGQLSTAFQYSATTAANLGISYNELVNVLSLMADAGIKSGSTLGTGFRQVISQLEAPTTRFKTVLGALHLTMDAIDVKSHGIITVLETLKTAGFDAADAYQAFGNRGGGAIIAMLNQLDNVKERAEQLNAPGAAAKASATQLEAFSAAAKKMGNEVVALASNALNPFLSAMKGVFDVTGTVVHGLEGITPIIEVLATAMIIGGVAAIVKYAASLLSLASKSSLIIQALSDMVMAVRLANVGFISFGDAAVFSLGKLNPWILGITAVSAALVYFISTNKSAEQTASEAAAAMETAKGKYDDAKTALDEVNKAIKELYDRQGDLKDGSAALTVKTQELENRFKAFGLNVDILKGKYNELAAAMEQVRGKATEAVLRAAHDTQVAAQDAVNAANQNLKSPEAIRRAQSAVQNVIGPSSSFFSAPNQAQQFSTQTGIANQAINGFIQSLFSATNKLPSLAQTSAAATALNTIDITKLSPDVKKQVIGLAAAINQVKDHYTDLDNNNVALTKATKLVNQGAALQTQAYKDAAAYTQAQLKTISSTRPKVPANMDEAGVYAEFYDWRDKTAGPQLAALSAKIKAVQAKSKTPAVFDQLLQDIQNAKSGVESDFAKVSASAKVLNKKLATITVDNLKSQEQTLDQEASHAKSQAELGKIKGQITSLHEKLFAAAFGDEAQTLGVNVNDFVIKGFNVLPKPGTNYSKQFMAGLNQWVSTQAEEFKRQLNQIDYKGDQLDTKAMKAADAEAKRQLALELQADKNSIYQGLRNTIKTLDLDIQTHMKNITAIKDTIDQYTPLSMVRDRYKKMIQELYAAYLEQIQRLQDTQKANLTYNASLANQFGLGSSEYNAKAKTVLSDEDLAKQTKDIQDQFHDSIVQTGKDFHEAALGAGRLPANMQDAALTIFGAMQDPRSRANDWDKVDQTALLFQDIFTSVITEFRTTFSQLLLDIEEGTKSIGDALKDFAKGTLEAGLKAINDALTQKALSFIADQVFPAGFSDLFKSAQQINTEAIVNNTLATKENTDAILSHSGGGGGGGSGGAGGFDIPTDRGDQTSTTPSLYPDASGTGNLGGDVSGGDLGGMSGFFSKIGSFFTDLFSQIMSFLGPLMSQIGSALSSILPAILSIFNQGGLVHRAYGGLIPGSLNTRDSVVAPVETGSFIMRRTAVNNIGVRALAAINAAASGRRMKMAALTPGEFALTPAAVQMMGSKRLSRWNFDGGIKHFASGGMTSDDLRGHDNASSLMHQDDRLNDGHLSKPRQKKHVTNVYVVKENAKPQLTKNDIIVTVSEDMLTNGMTKKLVKSIAAGM